MQGTIPSQRAFLQLILSSLSFLQLILFLSLGLSRIPHRTEKQTQISATGKVARCFGLEIVIMRAELEVSKGQGDGALFAVT